MSAEELARKVAQRLRVSLGGEFRDWDGVVASEIKPYAALLLELREALIWQTNKHGCCASEPKTVAVLSKADEVLGG